MQQRDLNEISKQLAKQQQNCNWQRTKHLKNRCSSNVGKKNNDAFVWKWDSTSFVLYIVLYEQNINQTNKPKV